MKTEPLFPESWLTEQRALVQRAVERGWIRYNGTRKPGNGLPSQTIKKRATVKRRAE
jgi:hypothetical protein